MITFLLFTEEYTSKLPKHNLLLLPLRATKKKEIKINLGQQTSQRVWTLCNEENNLMQSQQEKGGKGILSSQDGNAKEDFD